MEKYRFIF